MSSKERSQSSQERTSSAHRFVRIGLFGLLILAAHFLGLGLGFWLKPPQGPSPEQVLKQSRQTIQHAELVMEEIQRKQPDLDRKLKELREGPANPADLK